MNKGITVIQRTTLLPSSPAWVYITFNGRVLESEPRSSCGLALLFGPADPTSSFAGRAGLGGGASHGSCHFGPPLYVLFDLFDRPLETRESLDRWVTGPNEDDAPESGFAFACRCRTRRIDHHLDFQN
jgi:hypothetical protein